jgi:hypothetical protein
MAISIPKLSLYRSANKNKIIIEVMEEGTIAEAIVYSVPPEEHKGNGALIVPMDIIDADLFDVYVDGLFKVRDIDYVIQGLNTIIFSDDVMFEDSILSYMAFSFPNSLTVDFSFFSGIDVSNKDTFKCKSSHGHKDVYLNGSCLLYNEEFILENDYVILKLDYSLDMDDSVVIKELIPAEPTTSMKEFRTAADILMNDETAGNVVLNDEFKEEHNKKNLIIYVNGYALTPITDYMVEVGKLTLYTELLPDDIVTIKIY